MIKEIREKTGLTQSQLALFLNVSRGMVNLVEHGQRMLNATADQKLTTLYLQLLKSEETAKKKIEKMAAAKTAKSGQKHAAHHHLKMSRYQLQAEKLKQQLEKLKDEHEKALVRLTLLTDLSAATHKMKKSERDLQWIKSFARLAEDSINKAGLETQELIQLELKAQLAYAAVHERMKKDLG